MLIEGDEQAEYSTLIELQLYSVWLAICRLAPDGSFFFLDKKLCFILPSCVQLDVGTAALETFLCRFEISNSCAIPLTSYVHAQSGDDSVCIENIFHNASPVPGLQGS